MGSGRGPFVRLILVIAIREQVIGARPVDCRSVSGAAIGAGAKDLDPAHQRIVHHRSERDDHLPAGIGGFPERLDIGDVFPPRPPEDVEVRQHPCAPDTPPEPPPPLPPPQVPPTIHPHPPPPPPPSP